MNGSDELGQRIIDYLFDNKFRTDYNLVPTSHLHELFQVGEKIFRRSIIKLHDRHTVVFGYEIEDEKYEELKQLARQAKSNNLNTKEIANKIKIYFEHIPRYIGLNGEESLYAYNTYRIYVIHKNGKKLGKVKEPILITEDELTEALTPKMFIKVA